MTGSPLPSILIVQLLKLSCFILLFVYLFVYFQVLLQMTIVLISSFSAVHSTTELGELVYAAAFSSGGTK